MGLMETLLFLDINPTICNHLLDFLMDWSQFVGFGVTISTHTEHRITVGSYSPLLYGPMTINCVPRYKVNLIVKHYNQRNRAIESRSFCLRAGAETRTRCLILWQSRVMGYGRTQTSATAARPQKVPLYYAQPRINMNKGGL